MFHVRCIKMFSTFLLAITHSSIKLTPSPTCLKFEVKYSVFSSYSFFESCSTILKITPRKIQRRKSGYLAGHSILPLCPTHLFGKILFKWVLTMSSCAVTKCLHSIQIYSMTKNLRFQCKNVKNWQITIQI